jgi:hypothetical protein
MSRIDPQPTLAKCQFLHLAGEDLRLPAARCVVHGQVQLPPDAQGAVAAIAEDSHQGP